MKSIILRKKFGSFLSDGKRGYDFALKEIIPVLQKGETVTLDFDRVENMTDSFANACLGTVFEDVPEAISEKRLKMINFSSLVRQFIVTTYIRATSQPKGVHSPSLS